MLKFTRTNLYMLFNRYPELRPALLPTTGGYQWTEAEIEQVLTHLSTHKRECWGAKIEVLRLFSFPLG